MDRDICKAEFYSEAKKLLSSYPELHCVFEELWKTGNYRLVYAHLEKLIEENELSTSDQYKKIDEAFYWFFVG